MSENDPINSGQSAGDCPLKKVEKDSVKKVADVENGKHLYAAGVWTKDTNFSAKLGQVVLIKVRNVNVLGTTIKIESTDGQAISMILLLGQEHEFNFYKFGGEPVFWKFDVSTSSDAFIVQYAIESYWVPGMPPNR